MMTPQEVEKLRIPVGYKWVSNDTKWDLLPIGHHSYVLGSIAVVAACVANNFPGFDQDVLDLVWLKIDGKKSDRETVEDWAASEGFHRVTLDLSEGTSPSPLWITLESDFIDGDELSFSGSTPDEVYAKAAEWVREHQP